MPDLPRINSDDWIDLDDGEDAIVVATVYSSDRNGLVVSFSDWTLLAIDADRRCNIPVGEPIEIEVTRTEDGLYASADQVVNAEVQYGSI
jgi:hypothetical protein